MVKILFIDDQKFNHKVIDFILKDQDYNIYFEFNGRDGITRAKEVFPDLILLDIEMPGLNGFDTCKEFRAMLETRDTPIIFLSSHEEEEYIVKAFEYGGSDYISKPFKPREVIARIKSHLEKFFLKKELQYKKNELLQKNDELNKLLKEVQRNRELEQQLYVYKDKYHTLQQEDAFKKQLKSIKDELSHKHFDDIYFDVFYKPIDILSGDTYGTLKVKDGVYFLYIIDAMGKGLSASVTSIQSTSFINNAAIIGIGRDDFQFARVINSYTNYISKQILDDEMVCGMFILMDTHNNTMSFSSYGMPPILFQDRDENITIVKNNNPPIMEFLIGDSIDTIDISQMDKILFYSDGLNELTTKQNSHYSSILPYDFVKSTTINQLLKKI
jgi:DNA-binding response OmpR family regulator